MPKSIKVKPAAVQKTSFKSSGFLLLSVSHASFTSIAFSIAFPKGFYISVKRIETFLP